MQKSHFRKSKEGMELSITTLNQIINNFDLQARLYGKMAELARVQLENLKDRS